MDIRTLAGRLQVDKHNLDVELAGQPTLYFEAATEAARATERRELCKIELSLMVDEAIADLRSVTPGIAESRALREAEADPTVVEKRNELAQLKREEAEWIALSNAAMQKSHTLTGLGGLYSNSYYVRDSSKSKRRKTANEV